MFAEVTVPHAGTAPKQPLVFVPWALLLRKRAREGSSHTAEAPDTTRNCRGTRETPA